MGTIINAALLIYFLLLIWLARSKGPHILHAGVAVLSVPIAVWMGFKGEQSTMWLVLAVGAGGAAWALEGLKLRRKDPAEAGRFGE